MRRWRLRQHCLYYYSRTCESVCDEIDRFIPQFQGPRSPTSRSGSTWPLCTKASGLRQQKSAPPCGKLIQFLRSRDRSIDQRRQRGWAPATPPRPPASEKKEEERTPKEASGLLRYSNNVGPQAPAQLNAGVHLFGRLGPVAGGGAGVGGRAGSSIGINPTPTIAHNAGATTANWPCPGACDR